MLHFEKGSVGLCICSLGITTPDYGSRGYDLVNRRSPAAGDSSFGTSDVAGLRLQTELTENGTN
jgi:hypothetical protein